MKALVALLILWLAANMAEAAPWASSCIQPIASGQTVTGNLTTSDCSWHYTNSPGDIYYTDVYTFTGTAGQQIYIAMSSTAFDTFLEVYNVNDVTATALVGDDDGGGGSNSRIPMNSGYYTIPATGTYYIWAQSYDPNAGGTGAYTLTLGSNSVTPPPTTVGTVTVTEFYHPAFNHYFITAYPAEAASLAAGNLPPWVPTGQTFQVWNGPGSAFGSALANVCRFFSTAFAPKSGHFYSHNPAECPGLAAGGVWTLEASNAFYMMPTADGNCPSGTMPLYRLYNNGMGSAPNHRYTVSLSIRSTMIEAGWIPEGNGANGVFACVPQSTVTPPTGSGFQQEITGYVNTILGLFNGNVFDPSQLTLVLQSALTAVTTPGGTCPIATSTPSLLNATTIPPNVTINVNYGTGCTPPGTQTSISGSAVITLTNFAITTNGFAGSVAATFNNVKANGTLLANGTIQATLNLTVDSSGAISGPVNISLNSLQLATLGLSGSLALNLNSAGVTTMTTNIVASPSNVAIQLQLTIATQSNGNLAVNSTGINTVGGYTVQVNNLQINTSVCSNGPVGGSIAFTKGGQTGTLTFNSSCGSTYSGP